MTYENLHGHCPGSSSNSSNGEQIDGQLKSSGVILRRTGEGGVEWSPARMKGSIGLPVQLGGQVNLRLYAPIPADSPQSRGGNTRDRISILKNWCRRAADRRGHCETPNVASGFVETT